MSVQERHDDHRSGTEQAETISMDVDAAEDRDIEWISTLLVDLGEGRHQQLRLVKCPACGLRLWNPSGENRSVTNHLREEHGPADFGLSPLRDQEVP